MSFSYLNCNKYILLSGLILVSVLTNAKSTAEETRKIISPSTIQVSHSEERIYIQVSTGNFINLPKVVKENISTTWAAQPTVIDSLTVTINDKEKKEILELSNKLGVKVRDINNLPLYREAAKWIGTRYKWAGKSKKGVDCSGLTNIIIKTVYNKELDRSSHIIANQLNEELDYDNLRPGDLVFFSTLRRKRISHVGVYLGDGQFIHASRKGVVVSSLDESYYSRTLRKAGRI